MGLRDKRILIIGGTGSLGQALIRREAKDNHLTVVSRDEAKHWTLKNKLAHDSNVEFIVADIRDKHRMKQVILEVHPNIIILAAALKQVDTCERYPYESVQTNLLGINNVIESVRELEVDLEFLETLLMVSTDKACAPTNVYGMSKAISERIVTSSVSRTKKVKYVGVRYGNVLESRGSIIPLYRLQSQKRLPLTVTHEDMTRFIMTLDQSIDLIEATIIGAPSGEIWLPKLKSMKIMDLAEIFADKYNLSIVVSGIRPGEKLHEDLISEPESVRVLEKTDYFRLGPSLLLRGPSDQVSSYSSKDNVMSKANLESYLESLGIFEAPLTTFLGREIDEISLPKAPK